MNHPSHWQILFHFCWFFFVSTFIRINSIFDTRKRCAKLMNYYNAMQHAATRIMPDATDFSEVSTSSLHTIASYHDKYSDSFSSSMGEIYRVLLCDSTTFNIDYQLLLLQTIYHYKYIEQLLHIIGFHFLKFFCSSHAHELLVWCMEMATFCICISDLFTNYFAEVVYCDIDMFYKFSIYTADSHHHYFILSYVQITVGKLFIHSENILRSAPTTSPLYQYLHTEPSELSFHSTPMPLHWTGYEWDE